MTVTVVCDVLGEENNGTTIAAFNLIRSLRSKGHTVRVVCPDEDKKGKPDYYVAERMNFYFLNGYVAKNGVTIAKSDNELIERALDGADIVHIMTPFSLGHAAAKAAKRLGIPVSAGFHCQAENVTNHIFMMNFPLANHIAYRIFHRRLYRYCSCIHYPTKFICDTFEKEVGRTNHYVISNGVNREFVPHRTKKPAELEDKFVILFTGRYSKEKSHKVLIDAVSFSRHSGDIQLIFAGDGPQKKNLIEYSSKLKNKPIMSFFSRRDLIDVINYSDLYVHPAEIEIEAISCLEAISCGKVPVISNSARSATKYFALGENNLFKCNDPHDLAEKIDYWIEHPEERTECSRRYAGYAEQYGFDLCMKKMEDMLCENARDA